MLPQQHRVTGTSFAVLLLTGVWQTPALTCLLLRAHFPLISTTAFVSPSDERHMVITAHNCPLLSTTDLLGAHICGT